MDKTVCLSVEAGMKAPISPPRGQVAEETVWGTVGVAHNHGRFFGELGVVCVVQLMFPNRQHSLTLNNSIGLLID